jgi:hypothetical protein
VTTDDKRQLCAAVGGWTMSVRIADGAKKILKAHVTFNYCSYIRINTLQNQADPS